MRWLPVVFVVGCAVPPAQRSEAVSGTHVLWVDLTGASIAVAQTDDATADVSSLGAATVPAFDASVVAPKVDAAIVAQVLVDRARALYLPFNLQIVTDRPTSGDYAAVYVGGTASILATPTEGIAGVGDVDCDDADPRSTGFAFSASTTPDEGGVVALAATIAHEAGHGFGLEHTTDAHDPMYSVAMPQQTIGDLFTLAFGSGNYSSFTAGGGAPSAEKCGHADPLDNVALLTTALGSNPAVLGPPPAVTLDFPPARATLPIALPLDIDASGATRVEVYVDLELVAVLGAAPYTATIKLDEAASTTLTIEAVGADGQRARVARTFAVSAGVPPACNDDLSCSAPRDVRRGLLRRRVR